MEDTRVVGAFGTASKVAYLEPEVWMEVVYVVAEVAVAETETEAR